ncbi:DUF3592 domain-containing protein [Citrobacter braakii]|uniref:DUF3592 domain-containing protein n=1 Tax=Citrobacter braakii TaxID=57706 RepID=UPI0011EFFACA|nr:DUF3592 domain-containing protein [Citrobacter braakii]
MNKIFRAMVVVSVLLMGAAGYLSYTIYLFQSTALHSTGKITDLRYSKSHDSAAVWYPQITFMDDQNKMVTFESSTGSSSYRNSLGDSVDILYQHGDAKNAKINDVAGLYLGPIVLGVLGGVLLFFGLVSSRLLNKGSKYRKLIRSGKPLTAKIISVGTNDSISFNGRSPWNIVCQWLEPQTNTVHVFTSANFYYDPSPFISGESLTVYVSPDNYKKYYVDISAFPKKA